VEPVSTGTRITLTLEADVDAGPVTGLISRVLEPSLRRSNESSVSALGRTLADAHP
jgi:hypothetical protein